MRKFFFQKRKDISEVERVAAEISAAAHLEHASIFKHSQKIACYLSMSFEFKTNMIIDLILNAYKECYLPLLDEEEKLRFAFFDANTRMKKNRFGILEPENSLVCDASSLDLVIMPLVAFDDQGNRLGMGGGYYDKTFAGVSKPFLLGLGFEAQRASHLPIDPWDVKLDGVVTEVGIIFS